MTGVVDVPRGTTIRRFVVLDRIGEGAVYSAYDYNLDRKIAIKLVPGESVLEEAQALAKVSHRNVVAVHAVGTFGDAVFIAMEHVDGEPLPAWLARQRDPGEIITAAIGAGRGLAAAHACQLVHGDFQPANVLVDRGGRWVVVGFGVARAVDPAYRAPEGGPPTPASDQFSFCAMLQDVLAPHKIPARLRAVLARGLRPEPGARWPSMAALCDALAPDHRRRNRIAIAAAVLAAAGLGVGATLVTSGEREPDCSGGDERAAAVWSPVRRDALRAQLSPPTFERAAHKLDDYTHAWTAMYRETCRATHVSGHQSMAVLDLRMECLRRRLVEVGASLEGLAGVPRGTPQLDARALDAIGALSPIAPCADTSALQAPWPPPDDPVGRARVTALTDDLVRAKVLHDAGRYLEARAALQRVADAAGPLGYRPLEAEVLGLLGRAQFETDSLDDAERTLHRAIAAATAGDARDVIAVAWIDLVWIAGKMRGRPDLAEQRAVVARGAIELDGNHPDVLADLEDRLGILALERGDLAGARSRLEHALELSESALGRDDPRVAPILQHLALVRGAEGDGDEALAMSKRAIEIYERALGPDHPSAAQVMNDVAAQLFGRGHPDEALALWRKSLGILERAYGEHSPDTAAVRTSLALGLRAHGDVDEAVTQTKRALDDMTAVGADAPNLGTFIMNHAFMLRAAQRFPEAEREMERALAALVRAGAPNVLSAYGGLGKIRLALGNYRGAIEPFEHVLELRTAKGSPDELALARVDLAEALWRSKVDRKRARTLAREARETTAMPELVTRATAIANGTL